MSTSFRAGTLAEAALRLNREEGGTCRFICIQLPEPISDAYKDWKTVSELCRERIRRVAAATDLADTPQSFKSFLLAPSNFKQWRGDQIETPGQLADQIQMFAESEKENSQVDDMLAELLLKFGQELTTPTEAMDVARGRVFAIDGQKMPFVLESMTDAMIDPLVAMKPREIIAIDGVFHDSDTLKNNFELQCRDAGIKFTCL